MAEIFDFLPVDDANVGRWPPGMPLAAVNNAGRADEGILARWYGDTNGSLVSTGPANTYALTSIQTITAYQDGLPFVFRANATNTGPSTLDLNAIGPRDIKKEFDQDLTAGDIKAGQKVYVIYDSTSNTWHMMSHTPAKIDAVVQAQGDLIVGNDTPEAARLPLGAQTRLLSSNGTDVVYVGGVEGKAAAYTVTLADHMKTILVDATIGPFTLALEPAATLGEGFHVNIVKIDSTGNIVTIDPDGTETIRTPVGLFTALDIKAAGNHVSLACDGLNFYATAADFDLQFSPQPTTSGTLVTFNDIPQTARQITLMFNEVEMTASDNLLVRLGTTTGLEAAGYSSNSGLVGGPGGVSSNVTGLVIFVGSAASKFSGNLVLDFMTGDLWSSSHSGGLGNDRVATGGGVKQMPDSLTQVAILPSGGASFNGGSINARVT